MINVVEAGAVGNNSTPNHEVLQDLIDAGAGTLCFPPGRFLIEEPLIFPRKTGYHIIGCGITERYSTNQPASVITWGGEDLDGPMIQCQGTGLIWDGVGLWGRRFQDTPPKNPEQNKEIGIRICNSCDPSSSGSELDRAGKIWFKSLCVEDCRIGVQATGSQPADSCAFGYYRPNYCVTAVHLDSTLSTMFTFRYMHPFGCNTAFRVDNGGRIYVHAINVVMTGAGTRYLLDVQGGTEVDAFFHINGMKVDGNVDTFVVLNNVDDGDGLHLFRFTDAQFYRDQGRQATVNIDREGGSGQSVLEFVGARWMEEPLDGRITINGASANKPSRLIVRDSMLDDIGDLIAGGSSHYSTDAVRNWTLANGVGFS